MKFGNPSWRCKECQLEYSFNVAVCTKCWRKRAGPDEQEGAALAAEEEKKKGGDKKEKEKDEGKDGEKKKHCSVM